MSEVYTLNNVCVRCKEPLVKTAFIQQRLIELIIAEVALDLRMGDNTQLRNAAAAISQDLDKLLDGDYRCPKCGKAHGCLFCGRELEFAGRAVAGKCPECGKDFPFIDADETKRRLWKQYDEEKMKREKFNSLSEEDFKEIFTGGDEK